MKLIFKVLVLMTFALISDGVFGQGPPITGDKPIMLGGKTKLLKTLSEFRKTEQGSFVSIPFMGHYLPTSNSLVGIHIPIVNYNFNTENTDNIENIQNIDKGTTIGDVALILKYQFYRKDNMGKTFRIVAKTWQTFPTGKSLNLDGMSTGSYQSYIALVAGYESIKYGISNELGYNFMAASNKDELRYKLGFGLPLLKSTYPVKQVNLYFEYQNSWYVESNEFLMLYAQGIQYAKGRITMETSIQFPLIQTISEEEQRKYSLFLGTRYVF